MTLCDQRRDKINLPDAVGADVHVMMKEYNANPDNMKKCNKEYKTSHSVVNVKPATSKWRRRNIYGRNIAPICIIMVSRACQWIYEFLNTIFFCM